MKNLFITIFTSSLVTLFMSVALEIRNLSILSGAVCAMALVIMAIIADFEAHNI